MFAMANRGIKRFTSLAEHVRPHWPTSVLYTKTGMSEPLTSQNSTHFEFKASNIVLTIKLSQPPSTRPPIRSKHTSPQARQSLPFSQLGLPQTGKLIRFVGPRAPTMKRGLLGFFAVTSSQVSLASLAPVLFNSYAYGSIS